MTRKQFDDFIYENELDNKYTNFLDSLGTMLDVASDILSEENYNDFKAILKEIIQEEI